MSETRLYSKTFAAPVAEKGSALQSKFNAFTRGKNIVRVHDLSVGPGTTPATEAEGDTPASPGGPAVLAHLLYEVDTRENAPAAPRLFMKEFLGLPVSSELQTKVNSFTGGKDITIVKAVSTQNGDGKADVVVVYTKNGAGADSDDE